MAQRLDLHAILKAIVPNVYFQPPASTTMKYPCIRYERTNIRSRSADNSPYLHVKEYTLTVIDENPDSTIPDAVSKLSRCTFDRAYKITGLNHDVFNILF